MRLISLTSFIALGLLVTGGCAEAPAGVKEPQASASSKPGDPQYPSWSIKGYGKSSADARAFALDKARIELLTYLARQGSSFDGLTAAWSDKNNDTQVQTFISQNLEHNWSGEEKEFVDVGRGYEGTLQVDIGPKEYHLLLEQDRQARIQQRDFLLGKVLVGVLAVLIAVAGYFRLEDWTKGYYTGVLRVGAVLLALTGVLGSGYWILH